MTLIVTGSIGIDTVEAPTGKADSVLGGSCVYFSAAASFFGPVRLVGAVGEDFPDPLLDTIRHFKTVDLSGLERRQGSKTFRWHGKYHADMNNRDTVKVELNVLAEKLPPVPGHYRDSRVVFLANTHPAGQLELLSHFDKRDLVVADTMDLWIENEKATLLELLKKIDGLVLNDSEAKMLTGKTNLIQAGRAILALGVTFVVIKKGEHGAMLIHKESSAVLPAYPAHDVVDPTGAGDCFAGGMMGHLAAGGSCTVQNLKRAMAYGTMLASFNIEAFSLSRLLKLQRHDVDQRFNDYQAMLHLGENI